MQINFNNAKITAVVVSILIYSCLATDGSATVRSTGGGGHHVVGKDTHQSNRPPESQQKGSNGGGSATNNGHSSSSSTKSQQNLGHAEKSKSSYAMLSHAMHQAVHNEFSGK